jgi:hypothetical protein
MNRNSTGVPLLKGLLILLLHLPFIVSAQSGHLLSTLRSTTHGTRLQLHWQADSADHFIIEHSTDGTSFKTAGVLRSHAKNNNYQFDAEVAKGLNVFRVKIVYDGNYAAYTNVIEHYDGVKKITVFPNPSNGRFTLSHPMASGKEQIQVADMQGTVVHQVTIARSAVHTMLDLSQLQKGSYNLLWISEADKINLKIFIQ